MSQKPRCFRMVLTTSRSSMELMIRMLPRHFGQNERIDLIDFLNQSDPAFPACHRGPVGFDDDVRDGFLFGSLPAGDEGGYGVGGLDVSHALGVISRLIHRTGHKGGSLKISGRKRYLSRSTTTKCPGNRSSCFAISASTRGHFLCLSRTSMRIRIIPWAGFFRR
jgi:hypothetical protein